MRRFVYILISMSYIFYSCSNDVHNDNPSDQPEEIIVFQERDPSLPDIKTSPIVLDTAAQSRAANSYIGDSRLGYSYAVGNSILGNQENVIAKVVDIDIVRELDPEYLVSPNPLNHYASNSFTYCDYDTYESYVNNTKKIDKGFSVNLVLFKIGRKKTTDETFTSNITGAANAVFGELSMEYQNSQYSLLALDGDRRFYARECLSKTFKQNLYSSTIGSIITNYGEFVLTGYITGGKAFALYAGVGKDDTTSESRRDGLNKDIGLSFSWKKVSASGNANFGSLNGDTTSINYNTNELYTKLFVWGGNPNGIGFENAKNLKTISINLDNWVNTLSDENTHGIIDIAENGLYSISDFVIEHNFKERMRRTISGVLPHNPQFMTPRIDIGRIFVKYSSTGEALYDVAPVLITKQGDRIILRTQNKSTLTDAELMGNASATVFTQKASEIYEQKKGLYGLRIRSVSTLKLNPQLGDPLCVDLGEVRENEMYTYINSKTNMEYIYDPVRKIAFSLYVGSRDGDVILDDYGIRDWVESLPTKSISLANLANNYTIIGL